MNIDFFYILKAIIVAIVEGLTEYIPVSSTGHMILVGQLIGFNGNTEFTEAFSKLFEVVIQLGAILAVVVLYWKKIKDSVIEFFEFIFGKKTQTTKVGFRFGINVIIACLPMAVCGVTLYKWIKSHLFSTQTVAVGFIVGGILLIIIENNFRRKAKTAKIVKDIDKITPIQALKVGAFQCLSMWPGMSRSASTIMGGWVVGFNTTIAAEFSFFLSIPAMVGSSGMDLFKFKHYGEMTSTYWIALIVGFIVAFIVSMLVIDGFISYLKKKPMRVFAIYRVVAGLILVGLIFAGIIK